MLEVAQKVATQHNKLLCYLVLLRLGLTQKIDMHHLLTLRADVSLQLL